MRERLPLGWQDLSTDELEELEREPGRFGNDDYDALYRELGRRFRDDLDKYGL